jgi:hypothetical protein
VTVDIISWIFIFTKFTDAYILCASVRFTHDVCSRTSSISVSVFWMCYSLSVLLLTDDHGAYSLRQWIILLVTLLYISFGAHVCLFALAAYLGVELLCVHSPASSHMWICMADRKSCVSQLLCTLAATQPCQSLWWLLSDLIYISVHWSLEYPNLCVYECMCALWVEPRALHMLAGALRWPTTPAPANCSYSRLCRKSKGFGLFLSPWPLPNGSAGVLYML